MELDLIRHRLIRPSEYETLGVPASIYFTGSIRSTDACLAL